MAPKVSIIVPVYKVEKYLNRCVDSILAQTFTDFECILVDDGSPDGCPAICDEYAKKDNRIKVIHQENKGVSAARNAGLDAALGEWIGFVDSDDWIEKDMYEKLIPLSQDNGVDIIQFDYVPFGDESLITYHEKLFDGVYKIDESVDLPWWFGMIWSRLYSKKLIIENNISFPGNITWMEDTYFSYASLACSKKTLCIGQCFYHYFYRKNSAVNTLDMKKLDESVKAVSELDSFLEKNNIKEKFGTVIFNLKLEKKNSYLINSKEPNIIKFLSIFPELNKDLLKIKKKVVIIYFFIRFHFWFIAKSIILLYRKIKPNILIYN